VIDDLRRADAVLRDERVAGRHGRASQRDEEREVGYEVLPQMLAAVLEHQDPPFQLSDKNASDTTPRREKVNIGTAP
jgi:hypothetical protein